MINRILIRMKVVQTLYSYLLTRSYFNIAVEADDPASGSRDKRCAYAVYAKLLMLLLELSGYRMANFGEGRIRIEPVTGRVDARLSRAAAALAQDDNMRQLAERMHDFTEALAPIRARLLSEVADSSIYKEYQRKRSAIDVSDEIRMWITIFHTIVLRDKDVEQVLRDTTPDFTYVGMEMAVKMWETTLNEFAQVSGSLVDARRQLSDSLDKAYQLYLSMLQLIVDLTRMREIQLDEAKHKYLPSYDDLNPNTRLIDNALARAIAANPALQEAISDAGVMAWADDVVTLKHLLEGILASDTYKAYIALPKTTWADDCNFWIEIFKTVIIDSDSLAEALENDSVYWNDDLAIMGSFALKTLRHFLQAGSEEASLAVSLLPKYKDSDDENFGPKLFEAVVRYQDEYRAFIDERLADSSWDPERLAFMDIVIMLTAIAEIIGFESIPSVVSVNEYTEIANYYSTPKSGQFVTGMLYAIIAHLKKEGVIVKE